MRRIAIALALAFLAPVAHADTLDIVIGKTTHSYTGVVVQYRQHEALGRVDFGSTNLITVPSSGPASGTGYWTVVVDGVFTNNCQLADVNYTAQIGHSIVMVCP